MSDEDRNLFIDEGWKAQVQREKEAAAQQKESAPDAGAADAAAGAAATAAGGGEASLEEMPEASFSAFLAGFVPQALFALGLMPQEGQEQVYVDLGQALYVIQMLEMLEEKTQGNLTEQESQELTQSIGELKRIFALRAQQLEEAQLKQAGVDPGNLKGGLR